MGDFCSLMALIGAANLDTLALSVSWNLKGRRFSVRSAVALAVLTSLLTALSLLVGGSAAGLLHAEAARWMGALLLLGMGIRELCGSAGAEECEVTAAGWRDILVLGLALALNNVGLGIAAGLGGYSPLMAGVLNLAAVLAALKLGELGAGWLPGRWAGSIAGAVMVIVGLSSIL